MSVKAMNLVWEFAPYDGNTLLTMLSLADRADDEGVCWPSIATLAKKTRQSERNVQRCLAEISKDGFLNRTFRRDASTLYELVLFKLRGDNLSPHTGDTAVTPVVTKQAKGVTNRVVKKPCVSPNTSGTINRPVIDTSPPSPQNGEAGVSTDNFSLTSPDPRDLRHHKTMCHFIEKWRVVRAKKDIPNAKALGKNLTKWLNTRPERSYPQSLINTCIDNWALSHPRWHTKWEPWQIVLHLEKFEAGALSEFDTQIGITLDKAAVKADLTNKRLAAELDYIKGFGSRQQRNKL